MGASVQPESNGDRIARIVDAMRSQGASEHDIETYLTQSEGLTPAGPSPSTQVTLRNLARSMGQGATFGFSDELGLANRDAQKAFQNEHPVVDALAKIAGGAAAPIAATLALPELASLGGVVGLGALTGGLTAAGESEGSAGNRAKAAAVGAPVGAAAGLLGYGASKVLGAGARAVSTAVAPRRAAQSAVGQAAKALIDDPAALQARMKAVNDIAPGTSSPASALVAPVKNNPRFDSMARAIGASPKAGRVAESILTQQQTEQQAARDAIGAEMDKLGGEVQITPQLRSAMAKVRGVLGGKTPDVPAPDPSDPNPLGLEKSTPFQFDETKSTMDVQDLRDALSRLRFLSRGQVKKGLEANGVNTHDISEARNALQDFLYQQRDDFADLDKKYAMMSNEMRRTKQIAKTIELSRQNYAANNAYGASPESLGGSIHTSKLGALQKVLGALTPNNRAAVADATARMVLRPGASVADLLNAAPKPGRLAPALRAGLLTVGPSQLGMSLFGSLFQPDSTVVP